ncbi:MAG TPA: 30S ribosomal protein S20 [Phycisphaerae bacterium]|nr:30S ribosomal protein S20 [Phycisphaerae bacterium]HOB74357.1 30S ribosomal protein S20 [Phycisphaerae bacterium]HOJ54524.1 30S ribosomal protein S20 [Phycisphaerae bacterium]HOL26553.1 30S ribosomal protein S20 [Phycisphaerae bacterium]HPP20952.1 30S ribosomal protein S20 [Phycisphaerae bacterium]
MAHSLSSKKRIRQNVKRRALNKARKTQIKLKVRSFTEAVASGDKAKAIEACKAAIKKVDQVAAKGTIHKNTASRRKSRLQKKLNAVLAKA